MQELQPIGLINDPKIQKFYKNKFGTNLTSGSQYQVYISKKHGGGAGKYQISNINVSGQQIVLSLDFKVNIFEPGLGVINQRILFFKIEPNCKIIEVISSNAGQ